MSRISELAGFVVTALSSFRRDDVGFGNTFEQSLACVPLYNSGLTVSRRALAHRIVWALPQDALSNGWSTTVGAEKDATKQFDARFQLADRLLWAWATARQEGGAWLWVVDGDKQELPKRENTEIYAIQYLEPGEAIVASTNTDYRSVDFGRPLLVDVTVTRGGSTVSTRVHASRLVYVPGAPVTDSTSVPRQGYDVSYLSLYMPIIKELEEAYSSTGSLLKRLSMPWVKMRDGATIKAAESRTPIQNQGQTLAAKMNMFREGMDKAGLALLFNDDEFGWAGPSISGARELALLQMERLSSLEGWPLVKLFGQAPAGLSSDDLSGQRTYDKLLMSKLTNMITPVLLQVYRIAFGEDDTREIVWPAPTPPTELEQAQTWGALAARDAALFTTGALSGLDIRERLDQSGEYPFEAEDPIDETP